MIEPIISQTLADEHQAVPQCPVFLDCGGCLYQNLVYEQELKIKEAWVKRLFLEQLSDQTPHWEAIVPSPKPYHYRHRLDLTMKKTKMGLLTGFQLENSRRVIAVENCAIAEELISESIPRIRAEAAEKFTEKYRMANLVLRTGGDGRVLWGGIGRKSLSLKAEDYLWAEINGRKIFYSMDTFFQANHSILPALMKKIEAWSGFDRQTHFLDLYCGVGLFGVYFAKAVGKITFVEDSVSSVEVLRHNLQFHQIEAEVHQGRAEEILPSLVAGSHEYRNAAMIDPPRKGLHPEAAQVLAQAEGLDSLMYLSCNPETLVRDLKILATGKWRVERIAALDFFPKTRHVETLVFLGRRER